MCFYITQTIFHHLSSCTNGGGQEDCDKKVEEEAKKPTSCGMITDPKGNAVQSIEMSLEKNVMNTESALSPWTSGIFRPCHTIVPPELYFGNCVYDMCATDGQTVALCQAIESYADMCAAAGVPISWRNNTFCRKSEPERHHWSTSVCFILTHERVNTEQN